MPIAQTVTTAGGPAQHLVELVGAAGLLERDTRWVPQRINSAEYAIGAGGPGLGDARAGLVAGLVSAPATAIIGVWPASWR
ncbi:hypothetical protein LWC35_28680 [Pseudonocardia kujensis]|uniref:hypothetical protein n=1 Tax=Pseudonocardia kujensis TaxID=1128675 RepID=UPI001E459DC2|nr:hypothetical protein [Pseudonocardia kujensis]MCE0766851.1 hypothetical protein [Pseudonocardia kujensis]